MVLQQTILRFIRQHGLIPAGSMVIVGVSGGADSLALLHMLFALRETLDCRLHVATLDHGLRGPAGADDAAFVEATAHAWGLSVTAGRADVPALAAARGLSIETAARRARYDFLAAVCAAQGEGDVRAAVGHHRDDQAETVLLHLLRGAGIDGLGGMSPLASIPEHTPPLIRPLLTVTRAQIVEYCRTHGLTPRYDDSNDDVQYTRNRLRHDILPSLTALNPALPRALAQLADIARVEDDYLDSALDAFDQRLTRRAAQRISADRAAFAALHPALQRRWVRRAARTLMRDLSITLGYGHVVAALDIVLGGEVGALALLPGGLRLRVDYEAILLETGDTMDFDASIPLLQPGEVITLTVPGVTPLHDGWEVRVTDAPGLTVHARLVVPPGSRVSLTTRQRGDRFRPNGVGGTQTIAKWMIDHKVPAAIRERIPLLRVNEYVAAILWGEAWRSDVRFIPLRESNDILFLTAANTNLS